MRMLALKVLTTLAKYYFDVAFPAATIARDIHLSFLGHMLYDLINGRFLYTWFYYGDLLFMWSFAKPISFLISLKEF